MKSKALLSGAQTLFSTMLYCFKLSWRTSKVYTCARLLTQAVIPGSTLALAFLSGKMINLLADTRPAGDKYAMLIIFSISILTLTVLGMLMRKLDSYVQNMHNQMLKADLTVEMMTKALQSDVSFFDSAQSHDSFTAVSRDLYTIPYAVWNAVGFIGAFLSLIGSLIILAGLNVIFGFIVALCLIPTLLTGHRYTKKMYQWGLEHVGEDRKMTYYYVLAVDRMFAQEVRLFNMGSWIKQRYKSIWETYFASNKKLSKKQAAIEMLCAVLPEIGMASMGTSINGSGAWASLSRS